jgi:DNA-binding XRE family transcriptional regulator
MTYDPEANEAMQKPNTMGVSASDARDQQGSSKPVASKKSGNKPNNVRKIRIERMMSKAELARRANLSVLTIDRVEKGFGCRMDTKRKILEALGLRLADRVRVFGEEE